MLARGPAGQRWYKPAMRILLAITCLALPLAQSHLGAADDYTLGPDSQPQPGVPKGQILGPHLFKSTIFGNTVRQYWVYVPAQYEATRPAAVMVFQDGHKYVNVEQEYRVPVVFDNLIHKKEMPVTIGVFVNPGHIGAELPADPWRSTNRSQEYDTLSEHYARFVLEELLPEVAKTHSLTSDPEARGIVGASSGGICAFTAAWERPDAFRKVISHIGSFTNIRGGHVYPALVRKSSKRPMRIFLQDGSNDLDNAARQLAAREPGDGRWRSSSAATTTASSTATARTRTSTAARCCPSRCAGCGATFRSDAPPRANAPRCPTPPSTLTGRMGLGGGVADDSGARKGEASDERQRLVERLLGLVERGIGQGIEVPEDEWQALRAMAAGQPRSLELVERLRQVVADCAREIETRRQAGDDVGPMRRAIVEHVRKTVATASPASVSAARRNGE